MTCFDWLPFMQRNCDCHTGQRRNGNAQIWSLLLLSIRKVQLNVLKVWWDELTVRSIHRLAIGHCFSRRSSVCRPLIHMYKLPATHASWIFMRDQQKQKHTHKNFPPLIAKYLGEGLTPGHEISRVDSWGQGNHFTSGDVLVPSPTSLNWDF